LINVTKKTRPLTLPKKPFNVKQLKYENYEVKFYYFSFQGHDAGVYRCRADFYRAPTTINHMRLDVIGKKYSLYLLFDNERSIKNI
jgi:hypothetical protein